MEFRIEQRKLLLLLYTLPEILNAREILTAQSQYGLPELEHECREKLYGFTLQDIVFLRNYNLKENVTFLILVEEKLLSKLRGNTIRKLT